MPKGARQWEAKEAISWGGEVLPARTIRELRRPFQLAALLDKVSNKVHAGLQVLGTALRGAIVDLLGGV